MFLFGNVCHLKVSIISMFTVDAGLPSIEFTQVLFLCISENEYGSWEKDSVLSYECRTLLFKALHNLIERYVVCLTLMQIYDLQTLMGQFTAASKQSTFEIVGVAGWVNSLLELNFTCEILGLAGNRHL